MPFFCSECGAIQPPDEKANHFELLDVEKRFDVDRGQLEARYKQLQKRLHPDLFATKSEVERTHSAQQSAKVIGAYFALLRPLSRARHLLQLEGISLQEQEEGTAVDQELLLEVMEAREAIEEAEGDNDLRNLKSSNDDAVAECLDVLNRAWKANDVEAAKKLTQRLSYLQRISEEIDNRL